MKQVPTSIYHLNVQVPEKLDLFLNKYFPPVERSETSAMCVTLQQVYMRGKGGLVDINHNVVRLNVCALPFG